MIARKFTKDDTQLQSLMIFLVGAMIGFLYCLTGFTLATRKEQVQGATGGEQSMVQVLKHNLKTGFSGPIGDKNILDGGVSENLFNRVRVLCWVCTSNFSQRTKGPPVKHTWGRHCNDIIFISETYDPDLPTVKVPALGNREGLWQKTVQAFIHIHKHYIDQYDWFLKADDDSFIVMENMRKLLVNYNTEEPGFFGFHYGVIAPKGYMSGGGGYVLSREAVRRLVTKAFIGLYPNDCPPLNATGAEDADIGRCLHAVKVYPGDSRDVKGRFRFYSLDMETYVRPDFHSKNWWFWKNIYWPHVEGEDHQSDLMITTHYITERSMYQMEYLLNHVNLYSVKRMNKVIPTKKSTTAKTSKTTKNLKTILTTIPVANTTTTAKTKI